MGIQGYSEDQIIVNIPKTKGKTGNLWVSVNGVDIEIPRGMDVLVDRKYVEVIERCLKLEELDISTEDEIKAKERKRIGAASEEEVRKLSEEKMDKSELQQAVNDALTQAKESGEFNGSDGKDGKNGTNGKDGYTPVKGVDYWTEEDKAEIQSYVNNAILGGAW